MDSLELLRRAAQLIHSDKLGKSSLTNHKENFKKISLETCC